MCGRFALQAEAEEIADFLDTDAPQPFASRFNIAPSTPLLAKYAGGVGYFRWGLVPAWARDISLGNRMFNARAETLAEKPSFRNAFKRRRCLIPASGFYEWQREEGRKQPYYFHLDEPLFCFAGLWEHWSDNAGNELSTCTLLTTEAQGVMTDIHTRMPVVLRPQDYVLWLDHGSESVQPVQACIDRHVIDFTCFPVSTAVNSAGNDGSALIESI